jgi:predicted aspartyl protease
MKYLFSIILFGFVHFAFAQEDIIDNKAFLLTKFKFELLTGGVIIVHAQIENKPDTLNFIFDTGNSGISLDSITASKLNLKVESSNSFIKGISGIRKAYFIKNHSLLLPGLKVDNLNFHVSDYEIISSIYGITIHGIIGNSFFRQFIVSIDYDNQEITIYKPGEFNYPIKGFLMNPIFTSYPTYDVSFLEHIKLNVPSIFDIGAGVNFIVVSNLNIETPFLKKSKKNYETYVSGLGGKKTMQLTVLDKIKIGPYKFKKIPILQFEDDFKLLNYPVLGGILGNDLLRRFNVVINYPSKVIHLSPNKFIDDSFDYSYTGMSVYLINNSVTIEDIIPNSPAAKAGLISGDILIAINGKPVTNLDMYKKIMAISLGRTKITVYREGRYIEIMLRIINIK